MSTINYSSLLSMVCEIVLGFKRINDVAINSGKYSIHFEERPSADGTKRDVFFLKNEKGEEFILSLKQLAGLRMAKSRDAVKAKWYEDFKTDANGMIFQAVARELAEQKKSLEDVRLEVVHQLLIRNEHSKKSDQPVYQDFCYTGFNKYRSGLNALVEEVKSKLVNGQNYWENPKFKAGVQILRDELYASDLREGREKEENIVKLPIFMIC